jgi:hypothetical protein
MSITASWDNPAKTIIYVLFDDNWTWAEQLDLLKELYAMLDGSEQKVNLIFDYHNISHIPKKPTSQFHESQQFLRHKNVGTVVIIGLNVLMQFFLNVFLHFMPDVKAQIHLAKSRQEAYNIITNGSHHRNDRKIE